MEGINRRTLFATIAGLLCTKAKAEEPKAEVWCFEQDGVIESVVFFSDGCHARFYRRNGNTFRIDSSWSEKWGEQ